ncbi:hypothetical protein OQJ65_17160 [Vibrio sp. Sgm 22]|uniref:hypothetical protein n=1 Tax=unclassified Vibrio TaxID=2614977 RepID=UPI0022490296|nr:MULTISPECIES: hypothetical protein [unclassified Vibrio]MCX2760065.1 hypothetical protein [Vibrio sp. 14G-20]MCX2777053.1 hypothetical protein [Vibrio sp. Sgm 22]
MLQNSTTKCQAWRVLAENQEIEVTSLTGGKLFIEVGEVVSDVELIFSELILKIYIDADKVDNRNGVRPPQFTNQGDGKLILH